MKKIYPQISRVTSYAILVVPIWPEPEMLKAIENRIANTSAFFNIVTFADDTSQIASWLAKRENVDVFILPTSEADNYSRKELEFCHCDGVVLDYLGNKKSSKEEVAKYLTIANALFVAADKLVDNELISSPIRYLEYSFTHNGSGVFKVTVDSVFSISPLKTLLIQTAGVLKVFDCHSEEFDFNIPDSLTSNIQVTLMIGNWTLRIYCQYIVPPKLDIQLVCPTDSAVVETALVRDQTCPLIITDCKQLSFKYKAYNTKKLRVTENGKASASKTRIAMRGIYELSVLGKKPDTPLVLEFKAIGCNDEIKAAKIIIIRIAPEFDFDEKVPLFANSRYLKLLAQTNELYSYSTITENKRAEEQKIQQAKEPQVTSFLQRVRRVFLL